MIVRTRPHQTEKSRPEQSQFGLVKRNMVVINRGADLLQLVPWASGSSNRGMASFDVSQESTTTSALQDAVEDSATWPFGLRPQQSFMRDRVNTQLLAAAIVEYCNATGALLHCVCSLTCASPSHIHTLSIPENEPDRCLIDLHPVSHVPILKDSGHKC